MPTISLSVATVCMLNGRPTTVQGHATSAVRIATLNFAIPVLLQQVSMLDRLTDIVIYCIILSDEISLYK